MASSVFLGMASATFKITQLVTESVLGAAVAQNPANPPGVLMGGDLDTANSFLEIHNRYAVGIDLYTHAQAGFRAPYLNFNKSRGSQAEPTPPTLTGYESDSIGGINFCGYTGSPSSEFGTGYEFGCGIYTQVSEDWGIGKRGAFISIYGRNNGGGGGQQIIQFGGLDPSDLNTHNEAGITNNIIAYRPLAFGGNSTNNPMIKPVSTPGSPKVQIRNAPDTAFADLECGTITMSGGLVSYGANNSAGAGFRLVRVPNA